jgi:phosphoribosylaminoimidazole-succinocarboxamide synthase
MGSVKDVTILKAPTESRMGEGVFTFSDKFSVFDYGEMPDHIEGKGEALCLMASYNFKQLEGRGLKTHFVGLDGQNKMRFRLVRKIMPEGLSPETNNCMVPLEIIFRDSLPPGSSVFKRVEKGQTTWRDLGLDHEGKPGEKLKKPIIDFSTKFETFDRYFKDLDEVIGYCRLGRQRIESLKQQALRINDYLREKARQAGWEHLDGKVEAGIDPAGSIVWVDVLGTLDEDRFEFAGVSLSKELLREYYRATPWFAEFTEVKEKNLPEDEWPTPPHLPAELLKLVSDMYKSACNEWTGEKHFGVKPLKQLISEDYAKLKQKGMVR